MKGCDRMALTQEDLLAISTLLDKQLEQKLKAALAPIKSQLTHIEVDLLENNVLPRLDTIESCYVSTFNRYKDSVEKIDSMESDIDLLKKVVSEHSDKLQKIC